MNKLLRTGVLAAGIAAPIALAAPAISAEPSPTPLIVGGESATSPAIVQLQFAQKGGTYGCTGELISNQWILTAKHCVDGDDWMKAYVSNSTVNRGTPRPVDRMVSSPFGDVALAHLATPISGAKTLQLANTYTPHEGDAGTIFGYGLRANKARPDHLYKASVEVTGKSTDAYSGAAIHLLGNSGASNHGDSGGPLVINGKVVGVCSTGDSDDPGADIHAGANYANLTGSRAWIRHTAGV